VLARLLLLPPLQLTTGGMKTAVRAAGVMGVVEVVRLPLLVDRGGLGWHHSSPPIVQPQQQFPC
jgi:hypothetical protein